MKKKSLLNSLECGELEDFDYADLTALMMSAKLQKQAIQYRANNTPHKSRNKYFKDEMTWIQHQDYNIFLINNKEV